MCQTSYLYAINFIPKNNILTEGTLAFKQTPRDDKLKLVGFNNLTKSLSFNLYDFCAARSASERNAYVKYIEDRFTAKKIRKILEGICHIIEAEVLAVSDQDYEPWGASSLVLMGDLKGTPDSDERTPSKSSVMHLDKSHICAHTYPDFVEDGTICSFRIDIDIATCGEISPLKALNYMFKAFDSDVVVIDYAVRGFTRDSRGHRVYIDHEVATIRDYIDKEILKDYYAEDLVLQSANIWQTRLLRTNLDEQSYFLDPIDPEEPATRKLLSSIKREMRGVLHMWPD